ncbi:MAG TPA: hypothetical protein VF194_12610 [Ferrovibrio sp.]|uniref:hypothetical protein n=1 Tax=Ferrovibrio sp. TaxID=1917215 RepID=UPI002ED4AB68
MALGELFRRIFSDDPAEARIAAPSGRDPGSTAPVDVDDFSQQLNRLLLQQRSILSGNIHLVGLSKIRERLGDEWPRIADRAQDVAQKVIQRMCRPTDVYTRYDDLSFIIIFSDLTVDQAQLRCHEIGEEIGRRLLGENFAAEANDVSTGVFESDGSLVFSAVDKEELIQRLTGSAANATTAEQPVAELEAGAPDFSFAQIDRAKALASMEVMYRPMWNLRHKVIANYFATVGAVNVFGDRLWDTALRREYEGVLSTAEFDIFIARRALRDMAANVAQGQKILLGWPIHFETLASRTGRLAYLDLCRTIPDAVRQLLVLELDGMPEGTPQSRLLEIIAVIKPFCRGQNVRVPWMFRNFGQMTGAGLNGVGFDLAATPRGDAERIRILNEFAAAAGKVGLRYYVHGLNTRAQALAALAAGYEWINGDAVNRLTDLPGKMARFNVEDLYRGL